MAEKTREKRIDAEKRRLAKVYKDIDPAKKQTVEGLIQRCAYIRITLEDFEKDLNENGFTEKFKQGSQEPYDRKRPVAEMYTSMNTSYQKGLKQLTDLLPKTESKQQTDDGFGSFVDGREDL